MNVVSGVLTKKEIETQISDACENYNFICDHTSFSNKPPKWNEFDDIKSMITEITDDEFRESSSWAISYYILDHIRNELDGFWNIDKTKTGHYRQQAYIDGYGNLNYERIHRSNADITPDTDVSYIKKMVKSARKLKDKFDRFKLDLLPILTDEITKDSLLKLGEDHGFLVRTGMMAMMRKNEEKRIVQMAKLTGVMVIK